MWTQKRLLALYQRYNRRYWNGELQSYKIEIKKCRRCSGFTLHRSGLIAIDVGGHVNDDEVRLTLLHEMVHVAALDSPAHILDFWREVNRILGKGAPPELVLPVSRQLRTILRTQASPLDHYYCKRAVRKMEAERERLRRWKWETEIEDEHWETVTKFRAAARNFTWTQALTLIGPEADLVDKYGKPRRQRHAKVLAFIKKSFQQERRWHLKNTRR